MRKLSAVSDRFDTPVAYTGTHDHADLLVIGVNSTRGTISEAIPRLEADGVKVNHAQIRLLHPFPSDELKPLMDRADKVVVVENNATGQLANIIRLNTGAAHIENILKYDGNPFLPSEIHNKCKEAAHRGNIERVSQ